MEQLKQVLKYQFWILLGMALILPFIGWFMSRSMMAEAAARTETLKKANDSLVVKGDDPNETWPQQLGIINTEQEKQALFAWRELYERQKPFKVWPKRMVDDPSKIENVHQEIYREDYVKELDRVHQIVKPLDEDHENGIVRYGEELLPDPNKEWTFQAPTVAQIEAAQEDLWLLTAILSAIASVNEGASSPYDATVREIVELLLRGGSPKGAAGMGGGAKPAGGTSGGHAPAAAPGGGMSMLSLRGNMPSPGAGMGRGDTAIGSISDHKINPNDDLGPERAAAAKTGSSPTAPAATGTRSGHGGGAITPMGLALSDRDTASSAVSSRGGGAGTNRYCEEKNEWRTRGFSLEVIMDHRRVPDLLVALSNVEGWPINILRVHMADSSDGDLAGSDAHSPDAPRSMMPERRSGSGAPPGPGAGHAARGGGAASLMAPRKSRRSDDDADIGGHVSNAPSALDDPNLAKVSIVGVIYIFLKPKELPATMAPPQMTPGAPTAPAAPGDAAAATTDAAASSDDSGAAGDADEKPEPKTDESTDEPAATVPDAGADSKPKPDAEDKAASGDPR
jgi:hypothetical protein